MTNTSTNDTEASAQQAVRIANAGGELVRLTTQGVREATNMGAIKRRIAELGCDVPLVADVHFNPKAAYTAAALCDKVRINPGNFVDAARTFRKLTYTDAEYADEIAKIRAALLPLFDICREHSTALRLGVNHGSLSDRIMSRYGDTPAGMVESVMEFLRICRQEDFNDIVISIKASNTVVMVETVRLLVSEMENEKMDFPVHLGVTEAGDGEDGRIKSAVGIGCLLAEGIGDTIRVSLSEDPENEIPVAAMLRNYITSRAGHAPIVEPKAKLECTPRLKALPWDSLLQFPVAGLDDGFCVDDIDTVDASSDPAAVSDNRPLRLVSGHQNRVGEMQSFIDRLYLSGHRNPILLSLSFDCADIQELQVKAGADFGTLLLNGYGNAVEIVAPSFSADDIHRVALGILQATRLRISKTEYIACPGCGRTLFDLQTTLREVREATSHLKGLKIGVMGCIVNGPGEMADADYGYVGAGIGKVSLYKGKELIHKNIPREEALPALIALIKSCGDWHD
jgi:(E)-4-hydroxy-3-methylbut-2-enyl-diphosphate synthase